MARILGLDIGPRTVRATLVRTALRTTEVVRYLEAHVAPSSTPTGLAADPAMAEPGTGEAPEAPDTPRGLASLPGPLPSPEEPLRSAIADLFAQLDRPPDQVIVALDGREASLRVVELPAGAAKKVAEVLPFELDELVPFEMDEAIVDYQPVDRTETLLRVLAAAVPKERVAEYLAELRALSVDPVEVAVGAAALDGLIPLVGELAADEPRALVELRADRTEVCVLAGGTCHFARTLTGGMDQLLAGGEALRRELKRTFAAYRATGGAPFEAVYLCGEAAGASDAALPWLSEILGQEVARLSLPDAPGVEPIVRPAFALATALAGRATTRAKRLNLRRGDLAHTRSSGVLRQHARLLAGAAISVLLAFSYSVWARYTVLGEERQQLRAQLASVTEDIFDEETQSPTRARELLEGGRRTVDPLPKFTAYDVLDAISAAIPPEITHDTRRLTIEIDDETREGRFELQGTVASIAERDTIAANLEAHECITEIKPGPTSPGPGNQRLNYRLEADVHCPGDEPVLPESNRRRRSRRRSRDDR